MDSFNGYGNTEFFNNGTKAPQRRTRADRMRGSSNEGSSNAMRSVTDSVEQKGSDFKYSIHDPPPPPNLKTNYTDN